MTIKKTIEYLNINKTIIGFDHFKGMPFSTNGNDFQEIKALQYFIKFFKFKNVKLIDDDFNNINQYQKLKKFLLLILIVIYRRNTPNIEFY